MSIFETLIDDFKVKFVDNTNRGTAFEKICSTLLEISPEFTGHKIEVQRFETWAQTNSKWTRTSQDLGIDFVITDLDTREISAVQCKFRDYSDKQTLEYTAITNLISHASGNNGVIFSRLILMSNVLEPSRHLLQGLEQHSIAFYNKEWFEQALEHVQRRTAIRIDAIEKFSTINKSPMENVRFSPLPHQRVIIEKTIDHLATKDRMILSSACGTGKTFVGLHLIDAFVEDGGVAVIFVPSLLLVKQFAQFIQEQQDESHLYTIAVICSDENIIKTDALSISSSNIFARSLSSDEELENFLNNKEATSQKILITTYHSAYKLKNFQKAHPASLDFAIYDEAHKTINMRGSNSTSMDFKKRIFMTATPRIVKAAKGNDENILSMDDKEIYGEIGVTYSFRQAIEEGVLVNYKLEILLVPELEYADAINKRVFVVKDEEDNLIDGKSLAMGKIAKDLKARNKMGIVYFNSIKESRKFARLTNKHDDTCVYHVDGYMSTNERSAILKEVESRGGLLSNVSLLTEGVDVPELEVVMFAEQRSSQVDIVQSIGRVMRKSKNDPNKVGRIILPIAINTENEVEEWLSNVKSLKIFKNLLLALIESDSLLLENTVRVFTSRGDNALKKKDLFEDIFGTIVYFSELAPTWDVEKQALFIESLKTQAVDLKQLSWWGRYETLKSFIDEYKRLPQTGDTNEALALKTWLYTNVGPSARLSNTQKEYLDKLAYARTSSWDVTYEKFESFISNNQKLPYAKSLDKNEIALARWANNMKSTYRSPDKFGLKLKPEQITKLEQLPNWSWGSKTSSWDETFTMLSNFVNENRGFPSYKDNHALITWVSRQKRRKTMEVHGTGPLSDAQITLLESLQGWSWEAPEETEHLDIIKWLDNHRTVAVWDLPEEKWKWLRDNKAKISKSEELTAAFQNFEIWPSLEISAVWIKRYGEILNYIDQGDKELNLATMPENMRTWVRKNKEKIDKLGTLQQNLLKQLPVWDMPPKISPSWLESLEKVKKYMNQDGELDFGALTAPQLAWIKTQKQNLSVMHPTQKGLIEGLPIWDIPRKINASWLRNFNMIKEHAEQHGRINFSTLPEVQLAWVKTQYSSFDLLPNEKKLLLQQLPQEVDSRWMGNLEKVKGYMKHNDKTDFDDLPRDHRLWLKVQSNRFGLLSNEQKSLLLGLSFQEVFPNL